ncbi:hypothetical protein AA0112_g4340 [Alternaria arborescens]|nr:hypothetical protein AA0112_g4340 [Alternaria arborescens]
MPIFSNNGDNVLRKATANAILDRGKKAYRSISHVVFGDTSSPPTGFMEIKNEAEHQEANTTLFASVSSPEENPNGQPESIAYTSISSTYPPESALRATSTLKKSRVARSGKLAALGQHDQTFNSRTGQ